MNEMMSELWWEFGSIALAHGLAVASPGPDFALVLRQSLVHGRREALATAWGIGCGILVHVSYSLLGIALILRESPALFTVIKYVGAFYLAWLGWQALRVRRTEGAGPVAKKSIQSADSYRTGHNPWLRGFLTNLLNPKATLFFLALFTVLIGEDTPRWMQVGYGLWMAATTVIWFTLVGMVFTRPGVRAAFLRMGVWIDRLLGIVFLGFALSLLWADL